MIHGKKVVVVLPAYNAEATLEQTYEEIPFDVVDHVILVDDHSTDRTAAVAERLGIETHQHDRNRGYGANQKTCYQAALSKQADVVIMLHPDYQYTPKLIGAMASLVAIGQYDLVLASRIISGGAVSGGMPRHKYYANRWLTAFENLLLGVKFSEYHTGYRAFSRRLLEALPLDRNSDDFIFDNEIVAQCVYFDYSFGEVSCPTKYFPDASSIRLVPSIRYGLGVLRVALVFRLNRLGLIQHRLFQKSSRAAERPQAHRVR